MRRTTLIVGLVLFVIAGAGFVFKGHFLDSDSDGVVNNKDAYPQKSEFSADSDSDDTPDVRDAFPNDVDCSKDHDSDMLCDSKDSFVYTSKCSYSGSVKCEFVNIKGGVNHPELDVFLHKDNISADETSEMHLKLSNKGNFSAKQIEWREINPPQLSIKVQKKAKSIISPGENTLRILSIDPKSSEALSSRFNMRGESDFQYKTIGFVPLNFNNTGMEVNRVRLWHSPSPLDMKVKESRPEEDRFSLRISNVGEGEIAENNIINSDRKISASIELLEDEIGAYIDCQHNWETKDESSYTCNLEKTRNLEGEYVLAKVELNYRYSVEDVEELNVVY